MRFSTLFIAAFVFCPNVGAQETAPRQDTPQPFTEAGRILESVQQAAGESTTQSAGIPALPFVASPESLVRSAASIALFGAVSLLPVALLVLTAFVRISVVLLLARQALGSAQIPGNQVITALAFMLTALVMAPVAQRVYSDGIAPFAESKKPAAEAWRDGTSPIKDFMGKQIIKSKHTEYLWTFYRHATRASDGAVEPTAIDQFPLRAVAPAFLVSELTTALSMGFAIYLPFLVVDLVISVLLSSMGLFLLPPAVVSVPVKLILFVLADGWMLVSDTLVRSFA